MLNSIIYIRWKDKNNISHYRTFETEHVPRNGEIVCIRDSYISGSVNGKYELKVKTVKYRFTVDSKLVTIDIDCILLNTHE